MLLKDKKISPKTPEGAIASGISLVPEDRKNQGLILDMTIKENITAASMKRLSKKGFVNKKAEEDFTTEYVRSLNIKTPGIHQKVKNLSGGNQQKVVLGKWMGTDPDILIFDEPTRGIDVGAVSYTHLDVYKRQFVNSTDVSGCDEYSAADIANLQVFSEPDAHNREKNYTHTFERISKGCAGIRCV